jgi:hypothetical protein
LDFNKGITELYPEIYDYSGEVTSFGQKWGSYRGLYTLAQGDVRRFNEITELPLHQCLMYLAYESDKTAEFNKKIKK